MHGLAAAILIAGIIVPPAWLAYWVWEVWNEDVPVQQDNGEELDGVESEVRDLHAEQGR